MPGILQSQIADIVLETKKQFGELKWTDLTLDEQELHTLELFRRHREMQDGGESISWEVMVNALANARTTRMYGIDRLNDRDQMEDASIGWRHVTGGYALERRRLNMNRGSAYKIIDYTQMKRAGGMIDLAKLFENHFWGALPASDDNERPFGLRYWCVKNVSGNSDGGEVCGGTSNGEGDFTGNTVFSGTYPGGLNHARWRNFANKYGVVSEEDFIEKLWFATGKCKFKSPVPHPDTARGPRHRWQFYTRRKTLREIIKFARSQNDNLGFDIGKGSSETVYMGRPINIVEALDYDGDYPFYGIDWSVFYPVFLEGEYMQETVIKSAPNQHTVTRVHIDCTYNLKCTDRRSLFVLSKAAAY